MWQIAPALFLEIALGFWLQATGLGVWFKPAAKPAPTKEKER
jgi:hypothetical protein